jgi:2-oxo-4-hydroxy-4-carboxy--5-ureidoimidazoline (OHCU) decarboxylase
MAAFERRLQHDEASEVRTALEQIERIALLRLEELLSS